MSARSRRGQSGVTLIELLVATAIGLIIAVPMVSWLNTTLRSTSVVTDQLGRSNEIGLLNAYFPRDVAAARSVEVAPAGGALGDNCGDGPGRGRPVLAIVTAGSEPRGVVYSEATSSAGGAKSLWRRSCGLAPGAPVETTELVRNVREMSTGAACSPSPVATTCGNSVTVRLSTTPTASATPVVVGAARRALDTSTGPNDPDRPGVNRPIPRVVVTPFRSFRNAPVTLDASSSINQLPGRSLSYTWEWPPGAACVPVGGPEKQQCTFTDVGALPVALTVSDGVSNSTTRINVEVVNRSPIIGSLAVRSLTPDAPPGAVFRPGETFRLEALGAVDPDGDQLAYEWDLGPGFAPVPNGSSPVLEQAVPSSAAELVGERQVQVTVRDVLGGTDVAFVTLSIDALPNPQLPVIQLSPSPFLAGGNPRPLLGGVGGSSGDLTMAVSLRADSGLLAPSVALFRIRGGAEERLSPQGCTGTATTCNVVFGASDAGDYELRVYENPGDGPVEREGQPFRVGQAPTAKIQVPASGGTVPKVVTFDSRTSTAAAGKSIVNRRWDFGCGDPAACTSTDESPVFTFQSPGTYTVTLTVGDQDGLVDRETTTIEVVRAP